MTTVTQPDRAVPPSPTATATRTSTRRPPTFLTAPFAPQTWREHAYLWTVLLLAPFAFGYALLVPSLAAGLVVTVVGLAVPGVLVVGSRGWGAAYRGLARELLGADVAAPAPFVRPGGFWRSLGALLGDVDGWRALAFGLLGFPLAVAGWTVSVTLLVTGLGCLGYGVWYRYLPAQPGADGTLHRGGRLGDGRFLDSPGAIVAVGLAGVVLVWLWPWVQRGFTELFALLTRGLLGRSASGVRIAELRASRAHAVQDADARLRRIERDLHDGTQARLVAVAMQLGEARELLDDGGDPGVAAQLVATAHTTTKEALAELREIARGIHPPALDAGLAVALETLAARAPLPVELDLDLSPLRGGLAPEVESLAYAAVAELVTNAAKHAGATRVQVGVRHHDRTLTLRVHDDGRGGAHVVLADDGRRTGLAGLVGRVRAVDGAVDVSSPTGGPTLVTVTLPAEPRA